MWILFGCLIVGALIGWLRIFPESLLKQAGRGMMIGVLTLLLSMGLRIGVDQNTLSQMGSYGWQAFVFALAAIVGSVGVVSLLEKILFKELPTSLGDEVKENAEVEHEQQQQQQEKLSYGMIILILGVFILGIILGVGAFPEEGVDYLPTLTNFALNFTLLMVGIDLGLNREIWQHILRAGWQVLIAPLGVAIGSILGAMLVGICFGWSLREGGAVGAGFGWYSLSGVLISDLHSVSLGTIAFLSNIFREVLAIILVPFLARRVSPLALVAPGGATSMDSTLPIIVAVGPKGIGILAIISGFILSLLVPILVPLVLG